MTTGVAPVSLSPTIPPGAPSAAAITPPPHAAEPKTAPTPSYQPQYNMLTPLSPTQSVLQSDGNAFSKFGYGVGGFAGAHSQPHSCENNSHSQSSMTSSPPITPKNIKNGDVAKSKGRIKGKQKNLY